MTRRLVLLLRSWLLLMMLGLSPILASTSQARGPFDGAAKVTGITEVQLASLPPEARHTYKLIRSGGPFPYPKDGVVFGNREKILPRQKRGYYTEYTVKTPGERTRGARRIVVGGDPRSSTDIYYSDDHYQSFKRIRE